MEKLFLTTKDLEKQAVYSLMSMDTAQWVKEIITQFLEEYPFLQNEPMTVTWKKLDKVKGYAIGSLNVLGAQVPVIVKDYKLAPLDIMMFQGGVIIPLSDSTLKEVLTSPTPFKGIERAGGKSSLALFGDSLQHSPVDDFVAGSMSNDTSSIRDAVKVGSVIDKLNSVDVDSVREILTEIKDSPEIKANFEKNGTEKVLTRLVEAANLKKEGEIANFVRGLEIDRQMVYTDPNGNYRVKQANSAVDYSWDIPIAIEDAQEWENKTATCSKSKKKSKKMPKMANSYELMDKKGHFYINEDRNWHIFDDDTIKTAVENVKLGNDRPEIGVTGVWKLGNKVSMPFEVIGIEKSAEFEVANVYKIATRAGSLYINENNEWMMNDKSIVKTANVFDPEGSDPKVGEYGAWIVGDQSSTPFEVVGMTKNASAGGWEIVGFDGLQKLSYYPIKPHADTLTRHELKSNAYYVPGNAKFVKLGQNMTRTQRTSENLKGATERGVLLVNGFDGLNKISFYITREEGTELTPHNEYKGAYYVPKNAEFIKTGESINVTFDVIPTSLQNHVVYKDAAGLTRLEGPAFSKYGENHEINNLNALDTQWTLIHLGATDEDLKKVANLNNGESYKIATPLNTPNSPSVFINAIKNNYEKESKKIANLTRNLVKEAAVMRDEDTVDAILSLGLIKKHNVAEYVMLIPQYTMILGELAKLLLMTRLGLTQMPEETIKRAMDSLLEVIEVLKGIEGSIKRNN